jgi:hypothetical protein
MMRGQRRLVGSGPRHLPKRPCIWPQELWRTSLWTTTWVNKRAVATMSPLSSRRAHTTALFHEWRGAFIPAILSERQGLPGRWKTPTVAGRETNQMIAGPPDATCHPCAAICILSLGLSIGPDIRVCLSDAAQSRRRRWVSGCLGQLTGSAIAAAGGGRSNTRLPSAA